MLNLYLSSEGSVQKVQKGPKSRRKGRVLKEKKNFIDMLEGVETSKIAHTYLKMTKKLKIYSQSQTISREIGLYRILKHIL